MTAPRFGHDCAVCTFLGTVLDHDLYVCRAAVPVPTIIARHGDAGEDYASIPPAILGDVFTLAYLVGHHGPTRTIRALAIGAILAADAEDRRRGWDRLTRGRVK
jgi:hypothetical protein